MEFPFLSVFPEGAVRLQFTIVPKGPDGRELTQHPGVQDASINHPLSEKVKVKVSQSCPTLCDPMDYTVHGILQVRILEWVAFPFSRGSSQPRIEPRSPALQVDSLPAELSGKPILGIH